MMYTVIKLIFSAFYFLKQTIRTSSRTSLYVGIKEREFHSIPTLRLFFMYLFSVLGIFFTFFNSIPIKELILNYFGVFLLYLVIYTQNTFSNAYFADL